MVTLLAPIGTAIDLTLQELGIESFFPADAESDRWLKALLEYGSEPFALPPNSCVRMVVRGGSAHSLGGPSSTSKCRGFARVRLLRAIFARDVPLVALLAASWGTYLHWPALTDPLRASDIPVIAGRSVFITQELSQSYWPEHWALVDERTKAFFTAYYATDPDVIVRFIEKHGIDYWVIQPTHFSAAYLEGRTRFAAEPFNLWVQERLGPTPDALLGQLPETVAGFTDGLHFGLSSTELIEWLRTQ